MKLQDLTFERIEHYDPLNSRAKKNGTVSEWVARNDFEMAINSIIFDFEAEIHAPETSDDRRKIAKSAIDHRWKPLLKTIQDQFEDQDR